MRQESTELELTIVYAQAEEGWTSASVPALPGTISAGKTRDEARENVLDALKTMLSTPPRDALEHADDVERLHICLAPSRSARRALDR